MVRGKGGGGMLIRKPWVWGAAGGTAWEGWTGLFILGRELGDPHKPAQPTKLRPQRVSPLVLKFCCLLRPREVSGHHDTHFGQ